MDEEDMVVKEEDFLKVIKDAIVEEEKEVKEEADLNTGEVIGQNNGEDSPDYTEPVHRTQKPAEASLRFWMTFTTSKLSASMMMGRTLMAILTLFSTKIIWTKAICLTHSPSLCQPRARKQL